MNIISIISMNGMISVFIIGINIRVSDKSSRRLAMLRLRAHRPNS